MPAVTNNPNLPDPGARHLSRRTLQDLKDGGNQQITGDGSTIQVNKMGNKLIISAISKPQGGAVSASTAVIVRLVSYANIASLVGLLTIDGKVTVAGDKVLVMSQTDPIQNGLYVVQEPDPEGETPEEIAGNWVRAALPKKGMIVSVYDGVCGKGGEFQGEYVAPPEVDTDAVYFMPKLPTYRVVKRQTTGAPTAINITLAPQGSLILSRSAVGAGVYRRGASAAVNTFISAPDIVYVYDTAPGTQNAFLRVGATDASGGGTHEYIPMHAWVM